MATKKRSIVDTRAKQTDCKNVKKIKTNQSIDNELNEKVVDQLSRYFGSVDRLCRQFYTTNCISLSKALLGQTLCRRLSPDGPILRGRIVETEAYLGVEDKSCHSYGGRRTKRNESMFMLSGTTYVYFTYGMYYCFNLSAEDEGAVVLIRAVQPLEGIDRMVELRNNYSRRRQHKTNSWKVTQLANGPSKLCICFDINTDNLNKVDITSSPCIWIEKGDTVGAQHIVVAKRIGISGDHQWVSKELRFYIKDCDYVSHK